DLHTFDVVPIPERLQQGIREAKEDQIVHRFLAEVMIDAEDALLIKRRKQDPVELSRRLEVVPERLFHDNARAVRAARLRELLDDNAEQRGGNGEIMGRPLS